MSEHIRVLQEVSEELGRTQDYELFSDTLKATLKERYKANEWAIDKLRWRRVEDELPTSDGVYLVLSRVSGNLYPDNAMWCFGKTWDGIPWEKTNIVKWRPYGWPEDE